MKRCKGVTYKLGTWIVALQRDVDLSDFPSVIFFLGMRFWLKWKFAADDLFDVLSWEHAGHWGLGPLFKHSMCEITERCAASEACSTSFEVNMYLYVLTVKSFYRRKIEIHFYIFKLILYTQRWYNTTILYCFARLAVEQPYHIHWFVLQISKLFTHYCLAWPYNICTWWIL